MEIEYYGANCFRVKTKKTSVVFDDNLDTVGAKNVVKDTEAIFFSNPAVASEAATKKGRLVFDTPGEFEVGDISIKGIQARAHTDETDKATAVIYQCIFGNTTVTLLGHVHPDLSDEAIELAGGTDVLIVPVGGNGYTLDAVGATKVVKAIEPAVVIPSQYEQKGFKFEVPAAPPEEFVKTSALTAKEPADSYKVDKPDLEMAGQTHIVVLNTK